MSISIKIIKYLSILSLVFIIFTYAIFLNMEVEYIIINSKLISNNFLFTIFSGLFTSISIVLLSEIRQYFVKKRNTQDVLFSQFCVLYGQLLCMRNSINKSLKNDDTVIDKHLLEQPSSISIKCVENISNVDYTTFFPHNKIQKMVQHFRLKDKLLFTNHLSNNIYFTMAVNEDIIINLKTSGREGIITSKSPNTHKTLIKLLNNINPLLDTTNKYLETLDESVSKRYNWSSLKSNINENIDDYSALSLDDFLNR